MDFRKSIKNLNLECWNVKLQESLSPKLTMQDPIINYMMHGSDNFSNFITHNEKRLRIFRNKS